MLVSQGQRLTSVGVAWQVNKADTMPDLGLSFIETGGSKANAEEEAEEEEE